MDNSFVAGEKEELGMIQVPATSTTATLILITAKNVCDNNQECEAAVAIYLTGASR